MIEFSRSNPDKRDAFLEQSEQTIEKALKENRALSHWLISPSLEARDFSEAIQMLVDLLNLTGSIKAFLELPSLELIQSVDTRLRYRFTGSYRNKSGTS